MMKRTRSDFVHVLVVLIAATFIRRVSGVNFLKKAASTKPKVTVFGATGGLGQQACAFLNKSGMYEVQAITRNKYTLLGQMNNNPDNNFELLRGCKRILQANARVLDDALIDAVRDADHIIVSVGTTAFPTSKWKEGNNPKAACVGKWYIWSREV